MSALSSVSADSVFADSVSAAGLSLESTGHKLATKTLNGKHKRTKMQKIQTPLPFRSCY